MAELKTKATGASVKKFIAHVAPPAKRADAEKLAALMTKATRERPRMWGPSIIGFGQYHYRSERSTQEGDWPLTGFSPRKQNLTVYVMPGFREYASLLKKLGPHTKSVSCLYFKNLEDINMAVLGTIVRKSVAMMKKRYPLRGKK